MIALVVNTKNEIRRVEYDPPHYDVIKEAVGGWYEHVHPMGLDRPYSMMVNEEGLLLGLPMNRLGSELYGTPRHGQPIVGDVLFLKDGYDGGEPDVVGMTEDEAQHLGDKFVKMSGGIVHWAKE
ncbi:DUF3846 domain-containing protein [uncultured Oscillibacter sp.]|uniref:DUF3846 domain-containing protein n=1 Tax=uncultured Oscillibacter sp. TaxID=876091 RepID=UPI002603D24F|nr:DUF3846 domain-containing protein [uncultured Oscillibacter sp.]